MCHYSVPSCDIIMVHLLVTRFINKLDVWIQGNSAVAPDFHVHLKLFPCTSLLKFWAVWVHSTQGHTSVYTIFRQNTSHELSTSYHRSVTRHTGTCITQHQREMCLCLRRISEEAINVSRGKIPLAEWGLNRAGGSSNRPSLGFLMLLFSSRRNDVVLPGCKPNTWEHSGRWGAAQPPRSRSGGRGPPPNASGV